jgi:hypothetical protein
VPNTGKGRGFGARITRLRHTANEDGGLISAKARGSFEN